jgi:hypothetical protein
MIAYAYDPVQYSEGPPQRPSEKAYHSCRRVGTLQRPFVNRSHCYSKCNHIQYRGDCKGEWAEPVQLPDLPLRAVAEC